MMPGENKPSQVIKLYMYVVILLTVQEITRLLDENSNIYLFYNNVNVVYKLNKQMFQNFNYYKNVKSISSGPMTLPCGTPDLWKMKNSDNDTLFPIMEIISEPVKKLPGNSKRF
jgi:hypothetical protein